MKEIVIKIDDKLYEQIFSDAEIMICGGMRSGKTLLTTLLRAVRNGKMLEQTEWISVKEAYTKGEWLFEPTQNINNPWKCSCCGHRAGRYKYKTYKFCPWCGAKMDKGE